MRWDVVVVAEDGRTFDVVVSAAERDAAVGAGIAIVAAQHPGTVIESADASVAVDADIVLTDDGLLVAGDPFDPHDLAPRDLADRIVSAGPGEERRALATELARALGLPVAYRHRPD